MALKVGDLYVAVTASIGEAVASLAKLAKKVEDTAKKVKEAAEPIGNIGAVVAAGIGGAVVVAAQSNARLAAEVEHIKEVLYTFAAEVGDLFLPLARRVGDFLSNLVAHFQRMDPRVKQAVASFAAWVAIGGLSVGVIGKLAASVEGLAKGFGIALQGVKAVLPLIGKLGPVLNQVGPAAQGAWRAFQTLMKLDVGASLVKGWAGLKAALPTMAGMKAGLGSLGKAMVEFGKGMPSMLSSVGRMLMSFGAAAGPVLAVAAAIAGIVLLSGALYKNWGDIKLIASEAWAPMADSIAKMMGQLGELADMMSLVFVGVFDEIGLTVKAIVERVFDFVAYLVAGSAKILAPVARAAQMGTTAKALEAIQKTTGKTLSAGMDQVISGGAEAMAEAQTRMKAAKAALTAGVTATVTDAAAAVASGVSVAKDVAAVGLTDAMKGVKMMLADITNATGLDDLKGRMEQLLSWMNGASEARIRQPGDPAGDRRARSYEQLQAYADEDSKREADRAAESESERFAKALDAMSDEAERAQNEVDFGRDTGDEVNEEAISAVRAETERAQESFMAIWDETQRWSEDAKAAMNAARADLIAGFLGRMGELGGIIDSAKKGFEAGGFWGAIIAAIGELLMGTEEMAGAIEVLNGIIGQLSDIFRSIGKGLQPLLGAVGYLLQVVVDILSPLLEQLGKVLQDISPIIVMIGAILQALTPILGGLLEALGKALSWLVNNVLRGLFEVLRYVGILILYVIKGLGTAWNGIISAIQWVFKKLGDISIFGAHPLGFLKDWARGMEGAKVNIEALAKSIQELEGLTWDAAMAKARETAEVLKNRDALEDVNEALSNVPSLWKIALRRFESQDEQDGPNPPAGTQRPLPTGPTSPSAPTPESLPPGSGGWSIGGWLQEQIDQVMGVGAGTASSAASPGVTYNITGFDLTDAMSQARADFADRQRRAGLRLYGTAASVKPRYG